MDNNFICDGHIESFRSGNIRGWAVVSNITEDNLIDLYIDNLYISTIPANIFREDLKEESIREGIAGFLTPIPISFCNNSSHLIEIFKSQSNIKLSSKKLVLKSHSTISFLKESIVFDYTKMDYSGQKKIMLLAGFSNHTKLLAYQKKLIHTFQESGLYVVYIIASDSPEQLSPEVHWADRTIIRMNQGYDFASWATGLIFCQEAIYQAEEIFFVNDSIIGPFSPIQPLLNLISEKDCDIFTITASQDIRYHFQSYFWGIKKQTKAFIPLVESFFFYRHVLPEDKRQAIEYYEVAALTFFIDKGLDISVLFPEYDLSLLAEQSFLTDLNEHSTKWDTLLNLPFNKQKFANIQDGILNYADIIINKLSTNPSHIFWHELIVSGFPFIKKELITLNPANYPFPSKIRVVFNEAGISNLLEDLPLSNKLTRNI